MSSKNIFTIAKIYANNMYCNSSWNSAKSKGPFTREATYGKQCPE
jgi:hypothetical protein